MRQAYKRRPHDFKRRILEFHTGTYGELLDKEKRVLMMIKQEELETRYYNKKRTAFGSSPEQISKQFKEHWSDPERKKRHQEGMKAAFTEERRKIVSEEMRKRWADPEFRAKMDRSESNRKAWANSDKREKFSAKMKGRKMSDEARAKMSAAAKRRCTPEWAEKQGELMRRARMEKLGY